MRLSELCDLIGLRTYIAKRTRYGKRPGREPWQHTRAFLTQYAPDSSVGEVIALLEAGGATDDISAARWLLLHDELVP